MKKPSKLLKLESLRGLAALYVLIHHFKIGKGTWLSLFTMQGQVAVILFFILSGFVIYYASKKSRYEPKFKSYFIKRFRRIYPVLIVALIIAYLCASFSARQWMPLEGKSLIGNLLNIQDLTRHPGYWQIAYYGNTPLWSLSYEWWFYMIFFPIFKYVKEESQIYLAIGISIFGNLSYLFYPNQASIILMYFIIWWWGVEIAKSYLKSKTIDKECMIKIASTFLISVALLGLHFYTHDGSFAMGYHPIIELRHFIYAFALIVLGLIWKRLNYIGFSKTVGLFTIFAPISYGIYVFHFPLIMKYDFGLFDNIIYQYIFAFILMIILAYLVEVKLQNVINKISNKWL